MPDHRIPFLTQIKQGIRDLPMLEWKASAPRIPASPKLQERGSF